MDRIDPEACVATRVLIPQEAYVFTGTLLENLRYLWPDRHADDGDALERRSTCWACGPWSTGSAG